MITPVSASITSNKAARSITSCPAQPNTRPACRSCSSRCQFSDAGTLAAPAALMCCVDQLRSGDNNAMIWITAHQDMSINRFDAMNKLGLLSEHTGAAPFDKKSAGSFPAEGCGVFILRRLSDACNSNEPVLGIIHGVGAGTHSISWRASASASARGLQDSGMEPDLRQLGPVCSLMFLAWIP